MHTQDNKPKVIFQSDFDGTITVDDISFLILDKFAAGDWRAILKDYKFGRISVGQFNTLAFSMVAEDKQILTDYVLNNYQIRPGFLELVNYCAQENIRFAIVSNGLDFYIKAIINDLGFNSMEIYSARANFGRGKINAVYEGPDGSIIHNGFKESFARHFISQGYRIIYAGNGVSDFPAAKMAHHAFATESLVKKLDEAQIPFFTFFELNDVVSKLKELNGN